MQRTVTHTQCVARGEAGILRVGHIPDSILRSTKVGSRLIPEFCVRCPEVDVQAVQMATEQMAALDDGRIDVAILYDPPQDLPHLAVEELEVNYISGALLPAAHPLARLSPLHCRDLSALPLLTGGANAGFREKLTREMLTRGLDVVFAERKIADPLVLIGLVSVGAGWFPANEWVSELANKDTAVYREWAEAPIRFPCCAVWRRDDRSTTVQKFLAVARELSAAALKACAPEPATSTAQIRKARFPRSVGKFPGSGRR